MGSKVSVTWQVAGPYYQRSIVMKLNIIFFKQKNRREILFVIRMSVGRREILTTTDREDKIKVVSILKLFFYQQIHLLLNI